MSVNLDEDFKTAHLTSWPVPGLGMSRDFFDRNKSEVISCAKKYGYILIGSTKEDPEARKYYKGRVEFGKPENYPEEIR